MNRDDRRDRAPVPFLETSPEEVLSSEWVNEYERKRSALWQQILDLNNNMVIVEQVESFPFGLLGVQATPFWNLLVDRLYNISILSIWNIVYDTDQKALTLKSFKEQIAENLTDRFASTYEKELQKINFDANIENIGGRNIRKRFHQMRHQSIAHHNEDWHINDLHEKYYLNEGEIRSIISVINDLFTFLWFGAKPMRVDGKYAHLDGYDVTIRGKPPVSDIENLLYMVAGESFVLNMPEEAPRKWKRHKSRLTDEQVTTINEYRRQHRLPPVIL